MAFINQALQFAGFGLRVGDAPSGRAPDGQANVFILIDALKHIGRFPGRGSPQAQSRRYFVPQKSLFLVGRALEPLNPDSGECNLCHVEPLPVLHRQDVRADVRLFAEYCAISINIKAGHFSAEKS